MIQVTRLDGAIVFINETNIQWVERLPDTSITFLGGARILVKETPAEIAERVNALTAAGSAPLMSGENTPSNDGRVSNS
ncbi:MAG: hypothetical protein RIR26_1179 [Pseudomonadota bacterium]|jgi:uncharacterized protein YlzI (FlbEa/FlbD family)